MAAQVLAALEGEQARCQSKWSAAPIESASAHLIANGAGQLRAARQKRGRNRERKRDNDVLLNGLQPEDLRHLKAAIDLTNERRVQEISSSPPSAGAAIIPHQCASAPHSTLVLDL